MRVCYLFAIAKSTDIKEFGTDAIMKPFVEDLNSLTNQNLEVKGCTYGLLAFLGDNLGSHAIGGIKESFL